LLYLRDDLVLWPGGRGARCWSASSWLAALVPVFGRPVRVTVTSQPTGRPWQIVCILECGPVPACW